MATNYRVKISEIGHLTSSPSFLRCLKLCPGTQYEMSAPMVPELVPYTFPLPLIGHQIFDAPTKFQVWYSTL